MRLKWNSFYSAVVVVVATVCADNEPRLVQSAIQLEPKLSDDNVVAVFFAVVAVVGQAI